MNEDHEARDNKLVENENNAETNETVTNKIKACVQTDAKVMEHKETQATPPSLISAHKENVILKNKARRKKVKFSYETCKNDPGIFQFYTGLHFLHCMALWNFLGDVTDKFSYWRKARKHENMTPSKRTGPSRKQSPINQLFLTLIKLRRSYSIPVVLWLTLIYFI